MDVTLDLEGPDRRRRRRQKDAARVKGASVGGNGLVAGLVRVVNHHRRNRGGPDSGPSDEVDGEPSPEVGIALQCFVLSFFFGKSRARSTRRSFLVLSTLYQW